MIRAGCCWKQDSALEGLTGPWAPLHVLRMMLRRLARRAKEGIALIQRQWRASGKQPVSEPTFLARGSAVNCVALSDLPLNLCPSTHPESSDHCREAYPLQKLPVPQNLWLSPPPALP